MYCPFLLFIEKVHRVESLLLEFPNCVHMVAFLFCLCVSSKLEVTSSHDQIQVFWGCLLYVMYCGDLFCFLREYFKVAVCTLISRPMMSGCLSLRC